ncbi:DUF2863 family protein [Noviherbaspirillum pedocola]|uniref:DUF2863 family protein n=1 Tax=Noviherbaspirillum pedocola TaxID=2801341 RepID=A0A934W794_9BURK|nr:DUF2863 family protein [Noviherbaspirillum pedocola]MBK4734424.1 DUF2863 family protein [Noviherbaspirillum pedocola]
MRRPSKSRTPRISPDSQRLSSLAQAMSLASSRQEERAWERELDALIQKLLRNDHQNTLDSALDKLFNTDPPAYDTLMEAVEAISSSCVIEEDGKRYDGLLIAFPILAWTRFAIASGNIGGDVLITLAAQMHGHLLADEARIAIAPTLYSIDQLPRTHAETYALTQRIGRAALGGPVIKPIAHLPETAPFLADTRYLLATVVAPEGGPLFRWQQAEMPFDIVALRQSTMEQLRAQAQPTIERLLPGCGVELMMPEAYYVACREADRAIRPMSVHAAVHYLTHVLSVEPNGLAAIIGAFGEEGGEGRIDEYRISFTLQGQPEVIYGIVWPLYGQEEDSDDSVTLLASAPLPTQFAELEGAPPIAQVVLALRANGVADIVRHHERFEMEFCEDCGAPLFCDREAELVHAEMPEDAEQMSGHLH